MLGRLVHRADFERLLGAAPLSRSAHFAVHHVAENSLMAETRAKRAAAAELSTSTTPVGPRVVDDLPGERLFGVVVPKRHARRAATRNLIKRFARALFRQHAAALPAGHWLLRLRAPFAPRDFVSASSRRLAQAVRGELEQLLSALLAGLPARRQVGLEATP